MIKNPSTFSLIIYIYFPGRALGLDTYHFVGPSHTETMLSISSNMHTVHKYIAPVTLVTTDG